MRCITSILVFLLFFLLKNLAFSQEEIKYEHNIQGVVSDSILIVDSLSIISESVIIISAPNDTLSTAKFKINNKQIILPDPYLNELFGDTLKIKYNTLAIDLGASYSKFKDQNILTTDQVIKTGIQLNSGKKKDQVFETDDLDYNGNFARGFSFGNKQSLVLNSNFNLQLSGKISDDIEIAAALTDANIPIQAEGNTYQLNEFDKVFISLKKDKHQLNAGDLIIQDPSNYFSKYRKKIKGMEYKGSFHPGKKSTINTSASYAISRGKFSKNDLRVLEGNQGPYKLIGSGGERFLVVLSATENVFLDGKLLKRGVDYDYIIDYNLAEISFTQNIPITKDSRIVVEFEYIDQSYLRSIQNVSSSLDFKRGRVYFDFYNEQDSKSSAFGQGLDSLSLAILESSGDSEAGRTTSGVRIINAEDFVPDQVYYRKEWNPDTGDSIFVYSSNPSETLYSVQFSDLGEKQGTYIIKDSTLVNDRVYIWVGESNGRYSPVLKLIPPSSKQLFSLGSMFNLNPNTKLKAEWSLSNTDKNRFSAIDDGDNTGNAAMIQLNSRHYFNKKDSTDKYFLDAAITCEFVQKEFSALNPFRQREFLRDWNLLELKSLSDEYLISTQSQLNLGDLSLSYQFKSLNKTDLFFGHKHLPALNWESGKIKINAIGDFLFSDSPDVRTYFSRPLIEIEYSPGKGFPSKIGLQYKREKNELREQQGGILQSNSFYFDELLFHLSTRSKEKSSLQWFSKYRKDHVPIGSEFENAYRAFESGIRGNWAYKSISTLDYKLSFRKLNSDSVQLQNRIPDNSTLLGKIHHFFNLGSNVLTSNTLLEFNTGQEAKSEFIFLKLSNPGEGNYIWIDSNEDGIEQKGEFETAPFSDLANYIKILQYNNEFIKVNKELINNTIQFDPSRLFDKNPKLWWKQGLSKIYFRSIFNLSKKSQIVNSGDFHLPFFNQTPDTSIVTLNALQHFTLFINKSNPVFDLQLSHKKNNSEDLQLDGLIQFSQSRNSVRARWSIGKQTDLIINSAFGEKSYSADLYANKNYNFDYFEIDNEIRIRFSKKTGFQGKYKYIRKENIVGDEERLSGHSLSGIIKLRNMWGFNANFSLNYSNYDFNGKQNTSIELAMLEGLKNGNNFLWNIAISRKISKQIDLSIRYDGRKTGNSNIIHVASIQANATF